jgi:hypothetical protein
MKRAFPGQIQTRMVFSVVCGKCKESRESEESLAAADSKSEVRQILELRGWEMSRAWGLICPVCAR